VEIQQTSSGVAAVVGGEADIVFNCPTGVITPIIEAIAEADKIILADPVASDIVDIAAKYVTVERQAIINSNPKLGFTTQLATTQLKGYADALVRQGTIDTNPGDGLFAPEFKGITW
jgi:NitT/TauT family transport system substrate-binding protein